jgi:NAD(P)-dependent dehydrogenase (short-subunit alcohol dehydrogenase family)
VARGILGQLDSDRLVVFLTEKPAIAYEKQRDIQTCCHWPDQKGDRPVQTKKVETALITGGGSGMGRAVAQALCRYGIKVFVADVSLAAAEETARAAAGLKDRAEALMVDISHSKSVASLFRQLQDRLERLDLMVHTAAILGRTAFIEDLEDEEWRRMIAVNLDGAFYCCREAIRWMKMHQTGRIILFSSVASLTPTPGALHYSATKGGINMLGKTLAQEVAKHNIRVNIIAPGYQDAHAEWSARRFLGLHSQKDTPRSPGRGE